LQLLKGGDFIMNVLTKTGFKRPIYSELLNEQIARVKALFGEDIDTSELTVLGKFIRLNVFEISKLYEELELVYYSRFPNTAIGTSLDRLCVFNGISRNPAKAAVHIIDVYGKAGKTIKAGELIVGTLENVSFYIINDIKLEEKNINGEVTGYARTFFECTETGAIGNVPVGSINRIINPHSYVDLIEHIEIYSLGEETESDVSLRKRFSKTISAVGSGTIDSIYSAVLAVTGVTGCFIIENNTNDTVDGRPPKSFECYVLGGNSIDIANAIFNKTPIGIQTISTANDSYKEQVHLQDISGTEHIINFSRTKEKRIYLKITLKVDNYFNESDIKAIKNNIINHFAALSNGEDVIYSSIFSLIHKIKSVISSSVELSNDNKNFANNDIVIKGSEVARTNENCINIEVTNYVDRQ